MSVNGNATYTPLKQLVSESDSDDDNKNNDFRENDSFNNMELNSGLQSSKNNFSMSDMDDLNTNRNTLESTIDNVSFLQSDMSNKMSFPRRCAFIASVVCCVFTVIIFVWGFPCSEVGSCGNSVWQEETSWEIPYLEMELSGSIQVVDGLVKRNKNLIFIYRGNHMRHQEKNSNNDVNGVVQVVGLSGKVGWFTRITKIPTEIDCKLLDVNRDGQRDCIVSGTEGLLEALDPLSGTNLWFIHRLFKINDIVAIDFPTLFKDVDKDNVNELLSVATLYPSSYHNALVIISGAKGNVIGEPLILHECATVKIIPEQNNINVTYLCQNGTSEAVRVITNQLWYKTPRPEKKLGKPVTPLSITRRLTMSNKKNLGNTRQAFSNGPGKLIVENSGDCPNSCRVSLKLILERNGTNVVSWEYSANHVYAMRPSAFAFNIRGFVIKL